MGAGLVSLGVEHRRQRSGLGEGIILMLSPPAEGDVASWLLLHASRVKK